MGRGMTQAWGVSVKMGLGWEKEEVRMCIDVWLSM